MNRNRETRRTYLHSTKQNEEWRNEERKRRQGKKKELRNRGKCPCTHVVCNINLDILLIPRQSNWKFFCYLFTILWIITYFIVKTNFVSIILLHFLRIHVGCCLLREDVTWILYVICNLLRTRYECISFFICVT